MPEDCQINRHFSRQLEITTSTWPCHTSIRGSARTVGEYFRLLWLRNTLRYYRAKCSRSSSKRHMKKEKICLLDKSAFFEAVRDYYFNGLVTPQSDDLPGKLCEYFRLLCLRNILRHYREKCSRSSSKRNMKKGDDIFPVILCLLQQVFLLDLLPARPARFRSFVR